MPVRSPAFCREAALRRQGEAKELLRLSLAGSRFRAVEAGRRTVYFGEGELEVAVV